MEANHTDDLQRYGLYIDGRWVDAADGEIMPVNEPARDAPMAYVAKGSPADVERAVQAARKAFDRGPWPHTAPHERARVLHAIADLIEAHADELAELESRNLGVPMRKSLFIDLPGAAEHWHTFAEIARRHPYEPVPWTDMPSVSWNFIWRQPIGVCAQIAAWNYPLLFASWKMAPALAAGNVVIFKPASYTPLTTIRLFELIDQAGLLPRGTINLVTGPGGSVGEALAGHQLIDKISITGSTASGRRVMQQASTNVKRVSLELGGKSPSIVMPDADLDLVTDGLLFGVYLNGGQSCEASARCFVPRQLYDELAGRLVARASQLRLGNPLDLETDVGPMVSHEQLRTVMGYVEAGLHEGATLALGGKPASVAGFERAPFMQPTIFTNVRNDMRIAQEEIFGPVLAVIPYTSVTEAIELANNIEYGLGAAVWSRDIQAAVEVAKRIHAGTVWINDYHLIIPHAGFTGFKQSGFGNEHGLLGYLDYTLPKHIHVDLMQRRDGRVWWDALLPPDDASSA